MIKIIPVSELKVGMYINLSKSWLKHPFAANKFVLRSQDQIKKIAAHGIKKVAVDTEKSLATQEARAEERPGKPTPPSEVLEPMELILNDLLEEVDNTELEPVEKAGIVYGSSIDMMNNLLEQPTMPAIQKSKTIIRVVVNHMLKEEDSAHNLKEVAEHDYYTYTHSVNVGMLSIMLGKEVLLGMKGISSHTMNELGVGCFLHDLGKCKIEDALFNKKGKLSVEELRDMHRHPAFGYEILHNAKQLSTEAKHIILQHHERDDGKGYPMGLKGEQIHYLARLCAITDVYEALTSERPYKKALPPFEALKVMKEEMVTPFNREIFNTFVNLLAR
ncbi:MAG: HD-GYP domain-containing protein [Fidelibacterota bacterium]|nr:MAG: HD-GYP domain-containing protein [Candidatus Neomarinimicrobiota bacterium]